MPKLTDTIRSELEECNLSEKVNKLIELVTQGTQVATTTSKSDHNSGASLQSTAITEENNTKSTKRKRNINSNSSSSNFESGTDKRDKVTSQLRHYSKKRRVLQPYCFLSNKSSKRYKRCHDLNRSTTSTDKEENVESLTSNDDDHVNNSDYSGNTGSGDEENIFGGDKPAKESTPHPKFHKKTDLVTPILPVSVTYIHICKYIIISFHIFNCTRS